jgi:6-phosphogluconolactonase (cycloisomerase 2 family)
MNTSHHNEKSPTSVYASIGNVLTHYDLNRDTAALTAHAPLALPFKVQYVWPHPAAPYLYAACSNGSPDARGDAHCVVALHRDIITGALSVHGAPVALHSRPVHMTVDITGKHALIAYNHPSHLTVHRIERDGTIGGLVQQRATLDNGIYAHQVRVALSNKAVTLVTRGNKATRAKPEEPGALKVFAYDSNSGQLTPSASVAPNGGYGFGPRHIDFHPRQPWVYVSLELQNLMHVYRANRDGDQVEAAPAYVKELLADVPGVKQRQRSGTIHVHPNGQFAYVANRASGVEKVDGKDVYIGGENNIAVFKIDPHSGEPMVIQHADTRGVVARTFALDASGRFLIAANSQPILTREGDKLATLPASLAVFRVGDDGKLDYVNKLDVDASATPMFWMGIVG